MTTKLAHSDHILAAKPGEWLLACEPVTAVNMEEGGEITYQPGAMFRMESAIGGRAWVLDEDGRSVTFSRTDMLALERET